MDHTIRNTVFAIVIGFAILVWVVRRIREARKSTSDPYIKTHQALVIAVDLTSTWRTRHSGDGSDTVSARTVAQPIHASSQAQLYFSGWDEVSKLPAALGRQVLTSRTFINLQTLNLRLNSPQEKKEALQQIKRKNSHYRFTLPEPVPVTVRESAEGRVAFDYRG